MALRFSLEALQAARGRVLTTMIQIHKKRHRKVMIKKENKVLLRKRTIRSRKTWVRPPS